MKYIKLPTIHSFKQYLLHLRPIQLQNYIHHIKVLKKYNKLQSNEIVEHYKAFHYLFQDTPYPFTWDLYYENFEKNNTLLLSEKLAEEKKILFQYYTKKITILKISD